MSASSSPPVPSMVPGLAPGVAGTPSMIPGLAPPTAPPFTGTATVSTRVDEVAETTFSTPEKKIAIIGYTFSHRSAPWDEPGWEYWGLNDLHKFIGNAPWTRWFDLHDLATIKSDPDHLAWLQAGAPSTHDGKLTNLPVYVWSPQPDWPTAVAFPKAEMIEEFGGYFTNSISWMIAVALSELLPIARAGGKAVLGLWGIDMAQSTEYAAQRPSVEYFLGLARGAGIEVVIADTSDLLKTSALYGADDSGMRAKLTERTIEIAGRRQELTNQRAMMAAQLTEIDKAIASCDGAKEAYEYMLGVWTVPESDKVNRAENDVRAE